MIVCDGFPSPSAQAQREANDSRKKPTATSIATISTKSTSCSVSSSADHMNGCEVHQLIGSVSDKYDKSRRTLLECQRPGFAQSVVVAHTLGPAGDASKATVCQRQELRTILNTLATKQRQPPWRMQLRDDSVQSHRECREHRTRTIRSTDGNCFRDNDRSVFHASLPSTGAVLLLAPYLACVLDVALPKLLATQVEYESGQAKSMTARNRPLRRPRTWSSRSGAWVNGERETLVDCASDEAASVRCRSSANTPPAANSTS